ncbi:MAG TPA: HEAT repeat domain-containing protein [Pirellulales bacterium]|nr:HEAT repeat domain-containing protein [Pirellulales bacterium]
MLQNRVSILIACGILAFAGCNNEPSMDNSKLPLAVNVTVQPTDAHPPQVAAADALGRIGEPAVAALSDALTDGNPIVRLQSCRALAYMGIQAKDAVPALIRTLNDPEEGVREAAAEALGQVGLPAAPAVPTLIQMLRAKTVGGQ